MRLSINSLFSVRPRLHAKMHQAQYRRAVQDYFKNQQKHIEKSHYSKKTECLLVVSRYKEDLSWIDGINTPHVVFNKGPFIQGENYVPLPNCGREGHTILHFIISNYDNLPERIIFSQGSPFEHAPSFILDANNYRDHLDVQPLTQRYLEPRHNSLKHRDEFNSGIPNQTSNTYQLNRHKSIEFYLSELNGAFEVVYPTHYIDPGIKNLNFVKRHGSNSLSEFRNLISLKDARSRVFFSYAGIFSVSRDKVLNHSKSFYQKCIQVLLEDEEYGFLLERLWLTIFDFNPPTT